MDYSGFAMDTIEAFRGFFNAPVEEKHAPRRYHGNDAIAKVVEAEGDVDEIQKYVITHEGFVGGEYKDTKDITTSGVGQTGKYMGMTFKEAYGEHLNDAKAMVPKFDQLDGDRQKAIMSLAYRGDLAQSSTFRKLLNQGKYEEASIELLDHEEYLDYKKNDPSNGIVHRLEEAARFIKGKPSKPSNFKQAFKTAKEAGKKEFTFKGKRYSTKQA